MTKSSNTRRDFVKKAAYVAPAILTLAAVPSYAKFGSSKLDNGIGGISGSNGIGNTASNYGNRNYGNRNNGNIGNSALHAQSQFHANPYADYRARHGFVDYSSRWRSHPLPPDSE